jgi:hypothetical protein
MYLMGRSFDGRAYPLWIDINPRRPLDVVGSAAPLVPLGGSGEFDQDGIHPSCICRDGDRLLMYYSGTLVKGTTFGGAVGVLESLDGGLTFRRFRDGPVFAPAPLGDGGAGLPFVLRREDGFHMWYAFLTRWRMRAWPKPEPCYHIRHACSPDGMEWTASPDPAIDFRSERESGIARPWVAATPGGWEMWYCYRGRFSRTHVQERAYRIGFATSVDGQTWRRQDETHSFCPPAEAGEWDYGMQCYPSVCSNGVEQYLFYSGDAYGAAGVGYARRVTG